tara:strand:+ start:18019 stop:19050 length:1032 start_codon:yes stop_codon:yes gene_type:complete
MQTLEQPTTLSQTRLNLTRRPRRLRQSPAVRGLVRETQLTTADFIQPLFITDNPEPTAIESMPGISRLPIKDLLHECETLASLGIQAVVLFPHLDPSLKDAAGSQALNPDSLFIQAIRAVKQAVPELLLIADMALDPYTSHGHDGILNDTGTEVLNDVSATIMAKMAVLLAQNGCDWVAPSDMMDGRVGAIREALDAHDLTQTGILAYSAKYASAYYGPFRDAVGSAQAAGTHLLSKDSYQMDPANRREALVEACLDEEEGADVLMVKPAGAYLDIIREVREHTALPVAAYQVSGEYAQIHAAAQLGWLNLERCREESLLAIKRAGADMILSYFAKDMALALR